MRTPACPQTTGLPPDGQGYYTAHTREGPCIRLSYHQIYGGTRCKLKGGTSHEREPRHKDVWEMLGGTETGMDHPHQTARRRRRRVRPEAGKPGASYWGRHVPMGMKAGKLHSCDHCLGSPTREIGAFSPGRKRPVACLAQHQRHPKGHVRRGPFRRGTGCEG